MKLTLLYNRVILLFIMLTVMIFSSSRVYSLTIDFRDITWSAANLQTDFTVGDITLTASPAGATLWHDTTDGIGIRYSYEDDEIEAMEELKVSFLTPVRLDAIGISDLFYESRSGHWYNEIGYYSLDNGTSWIDFIAPDSNLPSPTTNGELTVPISNIVVTDLWFRAPGYIDTGTYIQDHEFSLQALDISPVPEASTLLLLVTGFIGITVLSCVRKRILRVCPAPPGSDHAKSLIYKQNPLLKPK